MILKVQLSLTSGMDASMTRDRQVLIYDEGKASVLVEAPASRFQGLAETMGDRLRAFFEADVIEHLDPGCRRVEGQFVRVLHRRDCECSKEIIFGKMLPDQGW